MPFRLPNLRPALEQFDILRGASKTAWQGKSFVDESIGTRNVTMHERQTALVGESHGDQILPMRGSKGGIVLVAVLGRLAVMAILDFDVAEHLLGQSITKRVGKLPVRPSSTQSSRSRLGKAPHTDENLTVGVQCNTQCARSVTLLCHFDGFANHPLTRIVEPATPIGNREHDGGTDACILKISLDRYSMSGQGVGCRKLLLMQIRMLLRSRNHRTCPLL